MNTLDVLGSKLWGFKIGTVVLLEGPGETRFWVGIKTTENEIIWIQNSTNSQGVEFIPSSSQIIDMPWDVCFLLDYLEPEETINNGLCTCDFYSIVLVTGCKCGGK